MYSARPFAIALAASAAVSLAGCSGNAAPEGSGDSAQAMPRSAPERSRNAPLKRHKQDATKLSGEGFYAHILLRVARNAERHNDHLTASTFYRRARSFAPYDKDIMMGLARSLEKAGEALEASEVYGAVLAEEERHEAAAAGLARTLEQIAGRSTPMSAENMKGGDQKEMAVQTEPSDQKKMAGDSGKAMEGGDAPAPDNGATRDLAALSPEKSAPEKSTDEQKSDDGAAASGTEKSESKFQDVLKAVEWKEDPAGSAQTPAAAMEPAGVEVAAATPATAVPGAPLPPTPVLAAPAMKPGGYKLQLAAYGNKARADAARSRLEARVKDLLGEISVNVEQSGKMFRVRTSPLGNRTQASGMCARLKSRSIGCFLVKPAKGGGMARKSAPKPTPKMTAVPKLAPPPKKTAKVEAPIDEAPTLPPIPTPEPTKAASAKTSAADTSKDTVLGWSDVMGTEKK